MDEQDNKVLLISKYALDCQMYNSEDTNITWENSAIREWLNNDFYNGAFSEEEQNRISFEEIENSDVKLTDKWDSIGGNNTEDKVFLLSYDEYMSYFNGSEICNPTVFAVEQKEEYQPSENGDCEWWLRSSGMHQNTALIVVGNAQVTSCAVMGQKFIRPAIWIEKE